MQRSSVLLARAVAWVESSDLNPIGRVPYPRLAEALVQRYNFQTYPTKAEDFDEAKGVVFAGGSAGETVIEQAVIYSQGLVLDTRTSTDESKRVLEEALTWAAARFGLHFGPGLIRGWNFVSQVVFRSEMVLAMLHPAVQKLLKHVEAGVRGTDAEGLKYEVTNLGFNYDRLLRKNALVGFTIQRRVEQPFSEQKFFSEAPLPTDTHWKLLEEFEKDLNP